MATRDESFPLLVDRIVEAHHRGVVLAMAQKTGLSYGTIRNWIRGLARPEIETFLRFCSCYGLDALECYELLRADSERLSRGEPVPLPDRSKRGRGPVPRVSYRRGRRSAGLSLPFPDPGETLVGGAGPEPYGWGPLGERDIMGRDDETADAARAAAAAASPPDSRPALVVPLRRPLAPVHARKPLAPIRQLAPRRRERSA